MEIARAVIQATPSTNDLPWSSIGPGPKPLTPVATRPIIFHTLDALHGAGVLETALITDASAAAAFKDAIGDGERWGMTITYLQSEHGSDVPAGLRAARSFIGGEPVLVQRADTILRDRLRAHIVNFALDELDALALMLVRPPACEPLPRLSGGYLLSPRAVSLMLAGPGAHDPLARLRRNGSQVRELEVEGCLACHGSEASLLEANRQALLQISCDVPHAVLQATEIQGSVVVHPSALLQNSLVRGPAIIGPHTKIVDSYIGPYTALGAKVRVEGTEIEHSIVMDGAQLLFVGNRLETSIIGRGARIVRRFDMPSAVRVSIGDGAHVALS